MRIARSVSAAALASLMLAGASASGSAEQAPSAAVVVAPVAEPATACALTPREKALAQFLVTKPAQLRPTLACDPALVELARERAQDMATRRYFKHDTPEGVGPNDFLRRRGFPLPNTYPTGRANTVEAIVGGYADAKEVWEELLGSALHRAHVLGEDPTFVEQDLYGIGYAREWNTPQVDFWVVLIARRAASDEPDSLCSPPPSECLTAPKTRIVFDPDGRPKSKVRTKERPQLPVSHN